MRRGCDRPDSDAPQGFRNSGILAMEENGQKQEQGWWALGSSVWAGCGVLAKTLMRTSSSRPRGSKVIKSPAIAEDAGCSVTKSMKLAVFGSGMNKAGLNPANRPPNVHYLALSNLREQGGKLNGGWNYRESS